jgi:hypothetical protein
MQENFAWLMGVLIGAPLFFAFVVLLIILADVTGLSKGR